MKLVCPESRGSGRGDEKGDNENESNGLEPDHRDGGDEAHKNDIDAEGGPPLSGCEIRIKAEEGEFL